MPFINKVTVRGKTYYLENLTDGTHVVKLPTLNGDDVFVTEKTLSQGIKVSSLTNGTYTVSLPSNLTQMIHLLFKVNKTRLMIRKWIRSMGKVCPQMTIQLQKK